MTRLVCNDHTPAPLAGAEARRPRTTARLARLVEETDANPESRIRSLQLERDRIEREIEAVRKGVRRVLPDERALERAREIIELGRELAEDFRRVKDEFDKLKNARSRYFSPDMNIRSP